MLFSQRKRSRDLATFIYHPGPTPSTMGTTERIDWAEVGDVELDGEYDIPVPQRVTTTAQPPVAGATPPLGEYFM